MTDSPQEAVNGPDETAELLPLTDRRFRNLWQISIGAALVLLVAWLTGPSPLTFLFLLLWSGLSGPQLYQWWRERRHDFWMSESAYIVRSEGKEWTYPFSAAAISEEKLVWVMGSERSSGRIVINILSCHEGILSDQVGERLYKAGVDSGIPGWRQNLDPSPSTGWKSAPFETGMRFALMGCFIPALGLLVSGIALATTNGA